MGTSTYTAYWGNVHEYTTQCASHAFLHYDTHNGRWDNKTVQTVFCDAASSNTGTIEDTIVFTHSTGALILGAALRNGLCTLGEGSNWYAASPPSLGSPVADWFATSCPDPGLWDEAVTFVADALGYCDGARIAPGYDCLRETTPGIHDVAKYVALTVSGAMCGTSAPGILSEYSIGLEVVALSSGENQWPNDGMVPYPNCIGLLDANFTSDFRDDYYIGPLNHADTTCRTGNSLMKQDDKSPCSWYAHRT